MESAALEGASGGQLSPGLSAKPATMVALHPWTNDDLWLLHETLGNPHHDGTFGRDRICEANRAAAPPVLHDGDMFTVWEHDAVVGSVGFWQTIWRDEEVYETGWMVLPKYAGRRLATQAALEVISIARKDRKHRYLHAFPSVEDAASNVVCRNAGFTNLGECTFEYPKEQWMRCNDWCVDPFANPKALAARINRRRIFA